MIKQQALDILDEMYENGPISYANPYNKAIRQAKSRIQSLHDNEWISVDDRLPEAGRFSNEWVLVFNGKTVFQASYEGGKFIDVDEHNEELSEVCEDVTHWQPLPNPPTL